MISLSLSNVGPSPSLSDLHELEVDLGWIHEEHGGNSQENTRDNTNWTRSTKYPSNHKPSDESQAFNNKKGK